ncbi:hypothetical protein BaRGS_00015347, partial [Batillaria attramentaria]
TATDKSSSMHVPEESPFPITVTSPRSHIDCLTTWLGSGVNQRHRAADGVRDNG